MLASPRPTPEWVSVRWPTRRSSQRAKGGHTRPAGDVGVSTSGRSAPRTAAVATAGVSTTPRTVPVAIVKPSPKTA